MKGYLLILLLSTVTMLSAQTLTGPATRQQLEAFDWFKNEYDSYKVSKKGVKDLKEVDKVKDYRIVIVMGTWCSDSRREVPRFYKVIDALGFPQDKILLVFVDENKNDPSGLGKQFMIKYVPTFIFLDANSNELGRIVETPTKKLDTDWLKIISK
ncbi:hypothetical protein BH09BAC1_BH09BAC1_19600 [soil metagenome]